MCTWGTWEIVFLEVKCDLETGHLDQGSLTWEVLKDKGITHKCDGLEQVQ